MARLRLDHALLSRVLREAELQRTRLGTRSEEARAVLGEALRYFADYAHEHHHPREDLLYARLAKVRPDLADQLHGLGREHAAEATRARALVASLNALPYERPPVRSLARFARELQAYIDATRAHMRHEERAVFYAGIEPALPDEDWQALCSEVVPDDPLADAAQLKRRYPRLATALAEPIREVSGTAVDLPTATDPGTRSLVALKDGADELVETYTELLDEGLELLRHNVASIWGAPTALDAVDALPDVGRRSYQFASRCVTAPTRVVLDCATRMVMPFVAGRATGSDE